MKYDAALVKTLRTTIHLALSTHPKHKRASIETSTDDVES